MCNDFSEYDHLHVKPAFWIPPLPFTHSHPLEESSEDNKETDLKREENNLHRKTKLAGREKSEGPLNQDKTRRRQSKASPWWWRWMGL